MNRQGFHVNIKPVTKGKGHSVIAKSAYNSGSKLKDKKTGRMHDYTTKMQEKKITLIDESGIETVKNIDKNVAHSLLILPQKAKSITVNREQFWNDIEFIEKSKKAQLGVEIDVMFPRGLTAEQRIDLAERYSQKLADRYNVLVDLNIHKPHTHLQEKEDQILEITTDNHHAHILLSSREILPNIDNSYSLSRRKQWGLWATSERLSKGLNGRGDELKYQCALWADLTNELLPENLHITEKSYREQGVNRLPTMKLGKSLYQEILKGKRSVIHEYNETISDLNQYIEKNGIEIDYNDQGRIDTEPNVQEFKGIKVSYKKRKPYASIELSKLTLKSPQKELDHASVLDNFMSLADNIGEKKKIQRSALFSSINSIGEKLAKQAERAIKLKNTYDTLPDRATNLGLDWEDDIALMAERIASIKTKNERAAMKQAATLLEEFRKDDTKQTTQSMTALKTSLETIDQQIDQNDAVFKTIDSKHNSMTKVFNKALAVKKPFDQKLNRAEKALKKVNRSVIEKEMNEDRWHDIFYKLMDIEVTDNMQTYNKYKQIADYDVDALKALEHTHEQLKHVKAAQIDDKRQQQMDTLLTSIKDYQDKTGEDLKVLNQQINTSVKTYERLEPFYSKRKVLLKERAPVIEQDDDLYHEITTTKTTQLNADRLDDWEQRVNAFHAQLIQDQEEAELAKQAEQQRQADIKRQQEQERQAKIKEQQEQERQAQLAYKREQFEAYKSRVSSFNDRIAKVVADIDFNVINAPKVLIKDAERVIASAMLLDGLQRVNDLTDVQHDPHTAQLTHTEQQVKDDTERFINQLDKLPNNQQKVDIIKQLNIRFDQVLERQANNEIVKSLQPKLEQQQHTAQQAIDRTNSYSSPRPF